MSEHPREIELKLEVEPRETAPLHAAMLAKLGSSHRVERLASVYFDTPKHAFRSAGLNLRVRSVDNRHVQTVKAQAGAGVGLFDRSEWETEIDGATPDLDAAAKTPLRPLLSKRRGALVPVFETVVERTTWLVETKHSAVEVCLDEGRVVANGSAQPLVELEFELKHGRSADLFSLVRKLDGLGGLRLGVLAKSDRGYALVLKKAPRAFKAEPTAVTPDITTAAAFQAIMRACLRQFRLNEPLVVESRDAEALHQARVALRRLRSALSLFKRVIEDSRLPRLKARLREVSRQLGDARNIDVYLSHAVRPEAERDGAEPGVSEFLATMEGRRIAAYDAVAQVLASKPFRRLMLDLIAWIESGPWFTTVDPLRAAVRDRPIKAFAAEMLARQSRKVAKRGRHLDTLDPHARHRVRIDAKKLRYASDFVASLVRRDKDRRRYADFGAALESLQDHLGDLNDIQTGHDIAVGLTRQGNDAAKPGAGTALFAAAHISGELDARVDGLLKDARASHRAFVKAKPFWAAWADAKA